MARLQLSKSALAREQKSLATFERFLPSLDLKRQQIMAERGKAQQELEETRRKIVDYQQEAGEKLSMLADRDVDLSSLANITGVSLETENVVGTRLPRLQAVEVTVRDYALLGKPVWVDAVAEVLRQMLELRVRVQVEGRRLEMLEQAMKIITQRVNLFDKVLIPRAKENIKRRKIYLSDMETAAVVRSKIAKRKRAATEAA